MTTGEAIVDSRRSPEGAANRIWPKRHEAKGYRRQGGAGAGPETIGAGTCVDRKRSLPSQHAFVTDGPQHAYTGDCV